MILNKITFNLSKTLIVLFPLLLITGPFLSDLSCVIISIFLWVNGFYTYNYYISNKWFLYFSNAINTHKLKNNIYT